VKPLGRTVKGWSRASALA